MNNRTSRYVLAAIAVAAPFAVGVAQMGGPPSPQQQAEKAVKVRQGLFEVQAFAFGPIGGMLKDAPFDAALVAKEAPRLQFTSSMIPEVFQLDTRQFQVTTKAKPGIWADKADFIQKAKDLQTAADTLAAAAKGGDKAAILQAAGAVGKACGACHDKYRDK